MECKHKNKIRMYTRGDKWKSTPYYECQDCGDVLQIGFSRVEIKTVEKSMTERIKDALSEDRNKFGKRSK